MPAAQLVSAGIELAVNKVLDLDEDSQARLMALSGKTCQVLPIELGFMLQFTFTDSQVLVTSPESDENDPTSTKKTFSNDECFIKLSVFAIPELQDMSNFTRLIREDKLDFEGNLTIAQHFADLFKQLDIDLEEELSKYLGDVAAHTLFEKGKQLHKTFMHQSKLTIDTLSDALLDEKRVAVRGIMVENFIGEVGDLAKAGDRLEARIKRLEKLKLNTSNSAE